MYEHRRIQASEHAGKSYLPAGRWKQVLLTTCPRCRNPVGLGAKRVRGETGSR